MFYQSCTKQFQVIFGIVLQITISMFQRCENNKTVVGIPKSLEKIAGEDFTTLPSEYIIKPGTKEFAINCSSFDPVYWNISLSKAYLKVNVEYHSETIFLEKPPVGKWSVCHTTSLIFSEVSENLTGLYSCNRRLYNQPSVPYQMYIYGASEPVLGKLLINREKTIKTSTTTYDEEIENKFQLILPCEVNYPANLSVTLSANSDTKIAQEGLNIPSYICGDYRSICISFEDLAPVYNVTDQLRKGSKITCSTIDSMIEDSVVLDILPSEEMYVEPSEPTMTLNVSERQPLKYFCKSNVPIVMSTNFPFNYNYSSRKQSQLYYKYYAEVTLIVPSSNYSLKNDEEYEWEGMDFTVTCSERENNGSFTWTHTLVNTNVFTGDLSVNIILNNNKIPGTGYSEKIDGRITPSTGKDKERRFACSSVASSSFKAFFVPCSTFYDCQMKSALLYSNNEEYRIKNVEHKKDTFEFELPERYKQQSGMVRCTGFQKDLMAFTYLYSKIVASNRIINSKDVGISVWINFNTTEVYEGDSVIANCTSPLLLLVGEIYWTFDFKNQSRNVISPDYISVNNLLTEEGTFLVNTAVIKIPEGLGVTNILCVANYYTDISPIVWVEGVLEQNAKAIDIKLSSFSTSMIVKVRPPPSPKNTKTIIVGSIFGVLFLIMSIWAIIAFTLYRKAKNHVDKLRVEEIEVFLNGQPELINENQGGGANNAQNSPYDERFEIDLNDLEIDYKNELGAGEFGVVFLARLKNRDDEQIPVAVKTLKAGADVNYLRAMMSELKVMLFIKTHENIVKIIGAFTKNLINHELFVVMEFCSGGDLLSHLRKHSSKFVNQVRRGVLTTNSKDLTRGENTLKMSTQDLFIWASQIANGMSYLSSLNVIHGDLAARNILLDSNLMAKISDFGLSKKLYNYHKYIRKAKVSLPWRWLAVESLSFIEFSLASDVWSFGVTLWEMFSLGALPYPGQEFNKEFIQMLQDGFRLPLPEYATYEIYSIVLDCWKSNPLDRPSFADLKGHLDSIVAVGHTCDITWTIHESTAVSDAEKLTTLPGYISDYNFCISDRDNFIKH